VRPEGKGRDQQYETIDRNAASQGSSCFGRVVSGEQQEDRTASDGIHDRKERAHDQENTLGNLNDQANLPWFLDLSARPGAVHLCPDGWTSRYHTQLSSLIDRLPLGTLVFGGFRAYSYL
jgi:hypothetical protein